MNITILIVEDSATQAQKLSAILEEKGYLVAVAGNGIAGLSACRAGRPDLVISDIVMPDLDGCEMCRQIKADSFIKDTPVILLTSLSDPQAVIRGLECGADGFTVKSHSDTAVLEVIERLLAAREHRTDAEDGRGIRVQLAGQELRITAQPQRIFDFLISTYDAAYRGNRELQQARNDLAALNGQLEARVKERTEELARRNEEVSATYQQLWHSAKLATLGELTASVAHELNNPLQTVGLRIESLSRKLSADAEASSALAVIEKQLDRMAHLVQNLLSLGRKGEQRIASIDAAEELQKTLELLQYHLRASGVEAHTDFPPRLPLVRADPEQLQQTFLNLFTNACDAMPTGGTLTVRIRGGSQLIIEVIDTGTGISAADLPRVMETFFTTKPPGKGTGLGLSICRHIVEAHGGSLSIESEPGKGTTVRIVLPAEVGEGGGSWLRMNQRRP